MSTSERTREEELHDLGSMIQGIKVAMLTTVASNGWLVSRPMFTRETEFDGALWFFVGIDSDKVDELQAQPQVNVAYADTDRNRYVSIAGRAAVLRDRERIDALWNERFDRLYFKGGKDDPSLALLRVEVQTAEVWNLGDNMLSRAFHFASAIATGDGRKMGEHRHVDLRH